MNNILKKIGKGALAVSILANTFMPLTIVGAEDDTYDVVIKLDSNAKNFYDLEDNENIISYTVKETGDTFKGDIVLKTGPEDALENIVGITGDCTDADRCVYKVPNTVTNFRVVFDNTQISVGRQEENPERPGEYDYPEVDIRSQMSGATTLKIDEPLEFNGHAVFLWKCDNSICYKKFTDLPTDKETPRFIADSSITTDTVPAKTYSVDNRDAIWAPEYKFESYKNRIQAGEVTFEDLKGACDNITGKCGIDYAPVNEPQGNNSLVSYGNRAFKAIIYGSNYKGLKLGSLTELDYYPGQWTNAFLRQESFDISGTTKENPTEITTILLEDTVNLKIVDANGFAIDKIEALDVNEDAVAIDEEVDGSWTFEFASNFYDRVTFKVTDTSNKEYFILINRRTVDPWIDGVPTQDRAFIFSDVFYKKNTTYQDYIILAKLHFKDGNSKIVKMSAKKGVDDGLGNIVDDYELNEEDFGGSGLKRATFRYETTKSELKNVDKIYLYVEEKGSTENFYSGTFAGSGKGNVIDMKDWEGRLN